MHIIIIIIILPCVSDARTYSENNSEDVEGRKRRQRRRLAMERPEREPATISLEEKRVGRRGKRVTKQFLFP